MVRIKSNGHQELSGRVDDLQYRFKFDENGYAEVDEEVADQVVFVFHAAEFAPVEKEDKEPQTGGQQDLPKRGGRRTKTAEAEKTDDGQTDDGNTDGEQTTEQTDDGDAKQTEGSEGGDE